MEKLKTWKSKLIDFWNETVVNKLLILVIISWIVLAIIFGFTDLAISIAVVDSDTGLGNFGDKFGEAPGWGLIAIIIMIIIAVRISKRNDDIIKQKLPGFILAVLGWVAMIIGIAIDSTDLAIYGGAVGISLLIFILLTLGKDWTNYSKLAIVIALLGIINPLLFVQILKYSCGRVRFNSLAAGFTDFTPWILPPWIFNNGESFPSGHTAMGWMFLPLLILVAKKDKVVEKDTNIILSTLLILSVIIWGLFVGTSRVIEGAHYASDVLFATGMGAVTTILLYKYYYLREDDFKFIEKLKNRSKSIKVKKKPKKVNNVIDGYDAQKDLNELSREVVEKYESMELDDNFP